MPSIPAVALKWHDSVVPNQVFAENLFLGDFSAAWHIIPQLNRYFSEIKLKNTNVAKVIFITQNTVY